MEKKIQETLDRLFEQQKENHSEMNRINKKILSQTDIKKVLKIQLEEMVPLTIRANMTMDRLNILSWILVNMSKKSFKDSLEELGLLDKDILKDISKKLNEPLVFADKLTENNMNLLYQQLKNISNSIDKL